MSPFKLLLLISLLVGASCANLRSKSQLTRLLHTGQDDNGDDNNGDGTSDGPTETDIYVAKFALNLECLEAQFYSYAAYGYGIPDELRGGGPEPVGGQKANLTDYYQKIAEEISTEETNHVKLLRNALGDAAVPCPAIDIGPAFEAAANAAFGTTLDPPYSPYYSDSWFLLGAFIFEDVGVTAYNGAAPLLTDKDILTYAAGVLAVEAYHGGAIRAALYDIIDEPLTPYPVTAGDGVAAVSALRALVGGGKDLPIKNDTSIVLAPADENSVAFARTPEEVLAIVYLGDSTKPGGFFPEGINL